ncbi:hypothetical protein NHX12_007521 [Muraenolepis orangiensis]|uniref:Uncharacterized protein n=1 Tax=Muraenolepis orangiensis TaxID=630683 RepID=A0A9Q0DQ06_9TELE|nr:hypothetical protein NHX12_007521 [Muraenolepis orangiensis]
MVSIRNMVHFFLTGSPGVLSLFAHSSPARRKTLSLQQQTPQQAAPWTGRSPQVSSNLTRALLTSPIPYQSSSDLLRPDQSSSDLLRPHQTSSDLTRAPLTSSDLTRAPLTSSDLTRAPLTSPDLLRPDQSSSDLRPPQT